MSRKYKILSPNIFEMVFAVVHTSLVGVFTIKALIALIAKRPFCDECKMCLHNIISVDK